MKTTGMISHCHVDMDIQFVTRIHKAQIRQKPDEPMLNSTLALYLLPTYTPYLHTSASFAASTS